MSVPLFVLGTRNISVMPVVTVQRYSTFFLKVSYSTDRSHITMVCVFPTIFFLQLYAKELNCSVVWSLLGRASISASYCIFFATSNFIATKMSQPQPYPPSAMLYLHGNTYHGPSFWCRRFLLVKGRLAVSGSLSTISSLVWVSEKRPIKTERWAGPWP